MLKRKAPARRAPATGTSPQPNPDTAQTKAPVAGSASGLRVRMYRVGFGDFFLVSVPAAGGARHILIDCGVHAGDIHSIQSAVAQMAVDTQGQLALIIMTHRHADHIAGFALCKDVFRNFTVERVWMSWFENPANTKAAAVQSKLTAFATHLSLALAARAGEESAELKYMAENITGPAGGGSNATALQVLHGGFKNSPPVDYYQAGDTPTLPESLQGAGLSAQILGPPIDTTLIAQMDDKAHQYLAGTGAGTPARIQPIADVFRVEASAYPTEALVPTPEQLEQCIIAAQPDMLAAQARQADNTLNNQSLVVLFQFRGRTLLFAGDAQWGNWANFLFGGPIGLAQHTALTERARTVLGNLSFYKVGHHGSTNATPIDVVNALSADCIGMCSTQPGAYGSAQKGSEVPRGPLIAALDNKLQHHLARSDQVPAGDKKELADGMKPPAAPFMAGEGYIDYTFPA
jgi:beta-lactamase superfamily II metal-dependent hydrolase